MKEQQPDHLVRTLARIIVAIERRRALTVIEGGKPMGQDQPRKKAG